MQRRALLLATFGVSLLAGCGSGSIATLPRTGGATPTPAPVATATATPTATPAPATFPIPTATTSTSTFAVGPGGSVQQNLGVDAGISGSLSLPATDQNANLTVVFTTGSDVPSIAAAARIRDAAGPLPQGPYLADIAITPSATITFAGTASATFDIGQLLGTSQSAALSELALLGPSLYAGIQDPAGNLTVAGPLQFSGTAVTAMLSSNLTIQAGTTYHIGLHLGVLHPVVVATPTPAPTLAPTATPAAQPTSTPTPIPTATPTIAPTATPTATPVAMNTPTDTITENINPSGNTDSASEAFILPYKNGFSASIGYPSNNSNVVSVTTMSVAGVPAGAPAPANETVAFGAKSVFTGIAPSNQTSITFQGGNTTIQGVLDVPFSSTQTFSLYVYAPALAGSNPIYSATGLMESGGGEVTFSSPLNNGTLSVPLPTTLYIEVAQP